MQFSKRNNLRCPVCINWERATAKNLNAQEISAIVALNPTHANRGAESDFGG